MKNNKTVNISELLPSGKDNAISMHALARRLGINERILRQRIHAERVAGHLICSDGSGYYKPKGRSELQKYCHQMQRRLVSAAENQKAAREMLKNIGGQMELFADPDQR